MQPDDCADIAAVERLSLVQMSMAALDDVVRIENHTYPFPWSRQNFIDSMAAGYTCTLLRCDELLAGYVVLMNAVDDLHILNITVESSQRGRGLSKRLLSHAEGIARDAGCTALLLEVRPSNVHARSVYEHLGFVRIGIRRDYYPAERGREDAVVMRKALDREQGT
jgi:ribosomal-protein-alanine acetyltransferase